MKQKKNKFPVFESIEITDAGAEGKGIGRVDNKVVFVPYVVPGDIVDIQITRKKKSFLEGKALDIRRFSDKRITPVCNHFGTCGGCSWQNMMYESQLYYKKKMVVETMRRIGGIDESTYEMLPIIRSGKTEFYRNRLDFTFSGRGWIPAGVDLKSGPKHALGFHIPCRFDRVLDITRCFLQPDPSNAIRDEIRRFTLENDYTFFNPRTKKGLLRGLIIRTSQTEEVMVIIQFAVEEKEKREALLSHIIKCFPQVSSLLYIINEKANDTFHDLEVKCFFGKDHMIEYIARKEKKPILFRIGPKTFFQTNSTQAAKLCSAVAGLIPASANEVVYDLYCGSGMFALSIADHAKKVIGIEQENESVENARINARLNGVENAHFFSGDVGKIVTDSFISEHGAPDTLITDPPRAGMHPDVLKIILKIKPSRIVYVSCNPATQARDIALLREQFAVNRIQPVDMFPHTAHVENIALLSRLI